MPNSYSLNDVKCMIGASSGGNRKLVVYDLATKLWKCESILSTPVTLSVSGNILTIGGPFTPTTAADVDFNYSNNEVVIFAGNIIIGTGDIRFSTIHPKSVDFFDLAAAPVQLQTDGTGHILRITYDANIAGSRHTHLYPGTLPSCS